MQKLSRRNASNHPHRPSQSSGNVYYARLKTPLGYFYKLGFTTLASVHERLAYQGKGNEQLLDKVLCFAYLEDAFDVEMSLHAHFIARAAFSSYCADPDLPLYGNGQSELYIDDILGLDDEYNAAQSDDTRNNIRLADLARTQKIAGQMRAGQMPKRGALEPDVEYILRVTERPLVWLMRVYAKFLLIFASESEKVAHAAHEGKHYPAKVTKSADIDYLLVRLERADLERRENIRRERAERIKQMMREAGLEDIRLT